MEKLSASSGLRRWKARLRLLAKQWDSRLLAPIFVVLSPLFTAALFVSGLTSVPLIVGMGLLMAGVMACARLTYRQIAEHMAVARSNRLYAETMRDTARTDPVTGLTNRMGFDQDLATMAEDLPLGTKLVLMWIDLRRFQEVNDSLGYEVGDAVLRKAADRIVAVAPAHAAISRFASDDFLIATYLPDATRTEQLAAEIGKELARPYRVKGHRIDSGAMIGIANMPDDAITTDTLMQCADMALYQAKIAGGNEVRFFHESMTRALARKKEVEAELRAAIQRDELSIFFQPIIDLRTGRIRSFEALVRWFHPDKGELYPEEFIPVAEDTGLIITLGNWITAQAARAASTWPDDVTLAVNLSPVQIKAPGAALGVLAALRDARLDPARLELEVTESLFLEDDEHTSAFIDQLSEHGVRFALDDFGTGYSSLHYIHRHPFRTIKVDRSFVSGANTGVRSDAIIRAVAEMGNTLDMEIVAEGLETIDQVHAVHSAGCTLGQGYYFSRAVPDFTAAMMLAKEAEERGETGGEIPHRRAS
ncbi:putative bifunctional diguanylate cyclase/phosphodiesterase [Aurantiacibacter sp. D1-12]|uniref:putative bifunctional diguanylate cyclase/phosphodiesterase n=1 Tax=Aurantiacibacter sp. D1-12 TaxID=2993658 RepID=UPI00237CBC89|nr:EAL domain-containing protein [Aurantiacibacter sp. D1-12]MDE1468021.1 EAL domain-containing protein [Aurantiacibacter sp. D1-12]